MKRDIVYILTAIYGLCLRLYPAEFRTHFAGEMTDVFTMKLEAAATEGYLNLLAVGSQECVAVVVAGAWETVGALRARPRVVANAGAGALLWPGNVALWRPLSQLARFLGILFTLLLLLLAGWLVYAFFFFTLETPPRVQEVALADLTGNGYLDAYLAISPDGDPYTHPDYLLFNEGDGRFRESGQDFGRMLSFSVKVADVNGDGRPDLVIGWPEVRVYRNSGDGLFDRSSPLAGSLGSSMSRVNVAVADLNNNGSLDVFAAGCCGAIASYSATNRQVRFPSSRAWLNNGDGTFAASRHPITQVGSNAVALADLNGNGAVDAFLVHGTTLQADGNYQRNTPNTVWLNDGQGDFSDSGQQLGQAASTAVVLGDLNGNGFPDAVVGNRGPDEVWFNDGQGHFSHSGRRLGRGLTRALFLLDLDGDGDLDLFVAGETVGRLWFNDGLGRFTAGQSIRYGRYDGLALGDVTGDGHIDIFVAGVASYQVWRGQGDGRFSAGPRTDFR